MTSHARDPRQHQVPTAPRPGTPAAPGPDGTGAEHGAPPPPAAAPQATEYASETWTARTPSDGAPFSPDGAASAPGRAPGQAPDAGAETGGAASFPAADGAPRHAAGTPAPPPPAGPAYGQPLAAPRGDAAPAWGDGRTPAAEPGAFQDGTGASWEDGRTAWDGGVPPADGAGAEGGHASRLLGPAEREQLTTALHQAVAGFIDTPRRSVEEADRVFEAAARHITDTLERRRRMLRQPWHADGNAADAREAHRPAADGAAGTEDLRVALQHYREATEMLLTL